MHFKFKPFVESNIELDEFYNMLYLLILHTKSIHLCNMMDNKQLQVIKEISMH